MVDGVGEFVEKNVAKDVWGKENYLPVKIEIISGRAGAKTRSGISDSDMTVVKTVFVGQSR